MFVKRIHDWRREVKTVSRVVDVLLFKVVLGELFVLIVAEKVRELSFIGGLERDIQDHAIGALPLIALFVSGVIDLDFVVLEYVGTNSSEDFKREMGEEVL